MAIVDMILCDQGLSSHLHRQPVSQSVGQPESSQAKIGIWRSPFSRAARQQEPRKANRQSCRIAWPALSRAASVEDAGCPKLARRSFPVGDRRRGGGLRG